MSHDISSNMNIFRLQYNVLTLCMFLICQNKRSAKVYPNKIFLFKKDSIFEDACYVPCIIRVNFDKRWVNQCLFFVT